MPDYRPGSNRALIQEQHAGGKTQSQAFKALKGKLVLKRNPSPDERKRFGITERIPLDGQKYDATLRAEIARVYEREE